MPPTVLRPDPANSTLELGAMFFMSLAALGAAFMMPPEDGGGGTRFLIGFAGVAGLLLSSLLNNRLQRGDMRIELHDDTLIYFNPDARRIDRDTIIEAVLETERDTDGVTYLTAIRHRDGASDEWSPVEKTVLPFGTLWDHSATVDAINRWLKSPVPAADARASGACLNFVPAKQRSQAAPMQVPPKGTIGRRHFGLRH
ncbi:MAG TPA: hypothetical protein PLQ11_03125 [Beijerinckiaceae bacterium]|nr:hypothetical protein [Beijerinckiaceae bacterium]